MKRLLLVAALLVAPWFAHAQYQPSGGGSGGIVVGNPIQGVCNSGYVLYSNSGALGCESVGGTGTVTLFSIVHANGFNGSVTNATVTPALTLTTDQTGILKGNGTAISAASPGTDYLVPGGALGTPSSATLTNATGLPISGMTGFGSGVATALGQPPNAAGGLLVAPASTSLLSVTDTVHVASWNTGNLGGEDDANAASLTWTLPTLSSGNIVRGVTTGHTLTINLNSQTVIGVPVPTALHSYGFYEFTRNSAGSLTAYGNPGYDTIVGGAPAVFSSDNSGALTAGDGPSSYLGEVATRVAFANSNGSAANAQGMSRSTHFARSNITSLQVIFAGFYYPSAVETPNGAASSVTASVEYPAGTITRITFSASNTGSIPSGSYLISDPVTVSIPAGAIFFIREWESNVNGIIYTNNQGSPASILMATDGYQFGATTPDLTGGGTVASPGFQGMHFPIGIIARTTRPSVCLFGDSRVIGYGDTMDAYGDVGEFARSVGPSLAYANYGIGGDTAFGASTTFTNRLALSAYCSHILLNYGINDVIFQGRTAAQLITNMNTIIALFPAGKEIWASTLPPVSSSTDGWATLVNQTTSSNNGARVTYNTAVRSGASLVGTRGYMEVAGAVESGFNSGLWAVPGYTLDGTHETQLANWKIQASGVVPVWSFAR